MRKLFVYVFLHLRFDFGNICVVDDRNGDFTIICSSHAPVHHYSVPKIIFKRAIVRLFGEPMTVTRPHIKGVENARVFKTDF